MDVITGGRMALGSETSKCKNWRTHKRNSSSWTSFCWFHLLQFSSLSFSLLSLFLWSWFPGQIYVFTPLLTLHIYKQISHDYTANYLFIGLGRFLHCFLAYQLMSRLNLCAIFEKFNNDYTLTTILDPFNSHCLSFCFFFFF